MTSEVELRALAEKHGYKLLSVKRFRVKDRTTFLAPNGIKIAITWRKHIEELDIDFSKTVGVWFAKEKRKDAD